MFRRTAVVTAAVAALVGGAALPATAATAPASGSSVSSASVSASTVTQGVPADTIINVTSANYDEVMQMSYEKPVVLDFTADWCYWCQKMKPYLKKFHAEDGGSWIWAKVDVDQNPELTRKYGVRGIPLLANIQNAQEAGSRHQGWDGPRSLRRWLNNL